MKKLVFTVLALLAATAVAACDDPLGLPIPFAQNVIDTVEIFALRGTPIGAPSGFDVARGTTVRTESDQFDFAFNLDSLDVAEILPKGALGLGEDAGIVPVDRDFVDVEEAPSEGYMLDSALVVNVDSVFVVRSRPWTGDCPFYLGALPRYGKFRVIDIDLVVRRIDLEYLVNLNCGYRQLVVGIPTR